MLVLSLATPTADTAQEEEHQPCSATWLTSPAHLSPQENLLGRLVTEKENWMADIALVC